MCFPPLPRQPLVSCPSARLGHPGLRNNRSEFHAQPQNLANPGAGRHHSWGGVEGYTLARGPGSVSLSSRGSLLLGSQSPRCVPEPCCKQPQFSSANEFRACSPLSSISIPITAEAGTSALEHLKTTSWHIRWEPGSPPTTWPPPVPWPSPALSPRSQGATWQPPSHRSQHCPFTKVQGMVWRPNN